MLGVFLHCLLLSNASEEEDIVHVEEHYTGKECDIRLEREDYFQGTYTKYPTSRNGNPHYMRGYDSHNSSRLLYCTRITSEMKCHDTVSYDLSVPEELLNGTITRIHVIDRKSPHKGGHVYIFQGGVDQRSVSLNFESLERKSMDYVVTILGVPNSQ